MLTGPVCFLAARLFLVIYNHCCLKGLLSSTVADTTTPQQQQWSRLQQAASYLCVLCICVVGLSIFVCGGALESRGALSHRNEFLWEGT